MILPEAARSLAARQGGVLSNSQLAFFKVSRRTITRLVAEGVLDRVTPGILSHGPRVAWEGRVWAGVLLGGPKAVVGMHSAAHLWGFGPKVDEVVIFTPTGRALRPGWRFLRAERSGVREPPRTRIEETVLDLCADADADTIAALIADVLSARRTTEDRLRRELVVRPTLRHRRLIRDILGDVAAGAHSPLERRYLVNVERPHGLPTALRQRHAVAQHRSDAWYREYSLLVELDSRLHHSGGAAFRDMTRDNHHALSGILTLRLGWQQVSGAAACETAWMVGQCLASRGWPGVPQSCRRCASRHPL